MISTSNVKCDTIRTFKDTFNTLSLKSYQWTLNQSHIEISFEKNGRKEEFTCLEKLEDCIKIFIKDHNLEMDVEEFKKGIEELSATHAEFEFISY